YAYLGSNFTASEWLDSIRAGRTFFTHGPLLEFRINQSTLGETLQLPPEGGTVRLEAKVWSTVPLTKILIYHNGKVWKELPPNSDGTSAQFQQEAVVSESGWYVLVAEGNPANPRADPSYPQAVSNAIRIHVGDQKIRSRASAEY